MFCPRCAAQNADDAKYCRSCGADISLVPQAVTGQLAERLHEGEDDSRASRRQRRRGGKPVTIERAVRSFFMGVAFVFVSLAIARFAPAGRLWWFWLLIPAFAMMADGVATYLRLKQNEQRLAPPEFAPPRRRAVEPPAYGGRGLPPRNTGELVPPPSVTEGTTRHLNVPAERKPEGG